MTGQAASRTRRRDVLPVCWASSASAREPCSASPSHSASYAAGEVAKTGVATAEPRPRVRETRSYLTSNAMCWPAA
jgi:hypothetical protein